MNPLKFSDDGTFRIMLLGDPHESFFFDTKSEDMVALYEKAAEELYPDLAIFMGDLVDCNYGKDEKERIAASRQQIERLQKPFMDRNIPTALVFGNHDGEKMLSKEQQLAIFAEYPNFIITNDEKDIRGCGNCNVTIKSSTGDKDAFNLWFIDSGNLDADREGAYDYVHEDQIKWYEQRSNELKEKNGGKPLPSFLFQHIPVMEEYKLLKKTCKFNWEAVEGHGAFAKQYFLLDKRKAAGYLGEGPCTPSYNSGQFESWKKQGDVLGAFFGHDHMNDFVGDVDGITLAQCQTSGFNPYGDGLHQGVRMITFDEDHPEWFNTYMYYYRDFFGAQSHSVKGIDLLRDRTRMKIRRSLIGLGILAGAGIIAYILSLIF